MVQYRVKEGVEHPVQVGPVGPQIDVQVDKYLPGGTSQIHMIVEPANRMDYLVLDRLMKDYKFTLADMANSQKGTIDIVIGAGKSTQIIFGTSVNWYEKMGLIKELK
ncbi:hypothetical protein ACTGV0_04100 [Streptococcus suis]